MMAPNSKVQLLAQERHGELRKLRPELVNVDSVSKLRTMPCDCRVCGGECCSGGAGLVHGEEALLKSIRQFHGDDLLAIGLSELPDVTSEGKPRTSVRVKLDGKTSCSWLLMDGRCSLQVLAEHHRMEKWAYKPLACSLFPLRVRSREGLRQIVSDSRCSQMDSAAPPCARQHAKVTSLVGLTDECAFIKKLWGHDLYSCVKSPESQVSGFDKLGIAAVSKKHVIWVGRLDGKIVAVKSQLKPDATSQIANEKAFLSKLNSRRFPRVVSSQFDHESADSCLITVFFSRGIPLLNWLKIGHSEETIKLVAQDLLLACVELDNARIIHQDLCPRNVLVNSSLSQISIVDFEHAHRDDRKVNCRGGTVGFAAPEQYLNWLSACFPETHSFFVGTVLFYSFYREYIESGHAFPFGVATPERMPGGCYAAMWALLGDPERNYQRNTRLSAQTVLKSWETLPMPKHTVNAAEGVSTGSLTIEVPGGFNIHCHSKGFTTTRDGAEISCYKGLIDVQTIKIHSINGCTHIGQAKIDAKSGIVTIPE